MGIDKVIFLDRDGVINRKRDNHVKNENEFQMLKDVPHAIKLLKENKYKIIVITNQAVINRGYITDEILNQIHKKMRSELKIYNTDVDAIYYCPHKPEENCNCRKPKSGMLEKAMNDFSIDKENSWFIGDSQSDIDAAKNVGIKSYLMETDSSLLESIKKILNI